MSPVRRIRRSKRPKDWLAPLKEKVETSFGSLYFSKNMDESGEKTIEIFFALDYIKFMKHFSSIPDVVFDNIGNIIIRKFKIVDNTLKNVKKGLYSYELRIRMVDRSREFIKTKMETIDKALSTVKRDQIKAINYLYDVLEASFLDNFLIQDMSLKQIRIKNYNFAIFNNSRSDQMVALAKESSPLNMQGSFIEYGHQEIETRPNLDFTRSDALEFYKLETMTPEKIENLELLLKKMQTKMGNLLVGNKNVTGIDPTAKTGHTVPSKPNIIIIKFKEILDMSDFSSGLVHNAADSSDISNIDGISLQNFTTANLGGPQANLSGILAKQDFDFSYAGQTSAADKETCKEGDKPLEILDVDDLKYVITQAKSDPTPELSQKESSQKLILSLVDIEKPLPEVDLEYLSGYNKNIMKDPVWTSSNSLTENDKGKEYLFRVKRTSSGKEAPIYNEYFVKKV
jgi:hypothetical protein